MTLIQENVIVQNTASGNNIDQNIAGDHSLAVQAAHGHVAGFEPIVVNESYLYNGDVVQHNVVVQNAASGDNIHQNAAGDNSLAVQQQQHWTPEQIHAKEVYQQSMDQYHAGTGNVHVQENVITQNAASGTNIHQNAAGNDSAAVQDVHSGSHLYQASHLGSGYHAQDNTITQNSASGWHINQNAAGNDSTAVQAVRQDYGSNYQYQQQHDGSNYQYQQQHDGSQWQPTWQHQDNTITQNTASGEHINQNAAGNDSEAGQWVHHDSYNNGGSDGTYDYQYQHHDQLHGQDNSITQNTASGEHINQNAAGNHSEAGQWVHHDELSGHKSDYHTYDHSQGWSSDAGHSWGHDATASAHTDYSHLMVPVHHG
ncbi:hypothetical protein RI367_003804 [Sorochytrium milnesiophthora]